jgi:hypothetical protein
MDSSHESSSPQAEVWERFGVTVFQALLILCVLLDIFVYFGVRLAPETVASVACTIRPFGVLATPLIPADWLEYIASDCAGPRTEPAISMIVFMVKVSLSLAVLLGVFLISATGSEPDLEKVLGEIRRDKRAFYQVSAKAVFALAVLVSITALAWFMTIFHRRPEEFSTSLAYKLILEDGCFILGMLLEGLFLVAPIKFVRPLLYRLFHKQNK